LVVAILLLDRRFKLPAMAGILDEALEALSRTAPEFENGNTNHAPMVAETLVTIGHGEMVAGWVDAYRRELGTRERPSEGPPIEGDWRESLGKPRSWPAWVSTFRGELAEVPWSELLDVWASRLAPGLSGAATHGLIRTAHAVRALGQAETEPRLNEFVDALAYWASTYHAFAPAPPPEPRHFDLATALARVPDLNPSTAGNIDQTLGRLEAEAGFAPVIDLLGTGPDPLTDLSALTERFAAVYLANAHEPSRVFALVHAVTGPSALRLLSPHVTKSTRELLLLYAWQTVAAIYGIWGKERTSPEPGPGPATTDELLDAALANGAAHSIKFAEACLREYEHNPKPVYLAAAADAAERLTG
jgi:hypothetical protein